MNKRKMMSAIADVKRAIRMAVEGMPLEEQLTFYQELSDWATCNEQIVAFHPNLNP